jgi:hypothetical protein
MNPLLVSIQMPKIRLISDIAPGSTHTAGIILEQIIKFVGPDYDWKINILMDDGLSDYPISRLVPENSISWMRKPQEWHPSGWITKKCIAPLIEHLSSREIGHFVDDIIRMESRESSDLIFIVIQGQSSYRVAQSLLEENYPVSLIFWDPWEWWELAKNVPLGFRKVARNVHRLANKRGTHLFPTEDFALDLGFKPETIAVLYPHVGKFTEIQSHKNTDQKLKNILFLGQAYASNEINEFFRFLKSKNFEIQNSQVSLHTYGRNSPFSSLEAMHHGWINYQDLAGIISQHDLGLLPYPAAKAMKKVSTLSFPSKLAQYLTANLDIVYVGPKTSSVVKFFADNDVSGDFIQISEETNKSQAIYLATYNFENRDQSQALYDRYFSEEAFIVTLTRWLDDFGLSAPKCVNKMEIQSQESSLIRSQSKIGTKKFLSTNVYRFSLYPDKIFRSFKWRVSFRFRKYILRSRFVIQAISSRKRFRSGLLLLVIYLRNKIKF